MPSGKLNIDDGLALAIAAGASKAVAAQRAGCSESTVSRRLADPAFRDLVRQCRAEMQSAVIGRLSAVGILAADELHRELKSDSEKIRQGAAKALLDFMLRGCAQETLTAEVEEIKRLLHESQHTTNGVEGHPPAAASASAADPGSLEPLEGGPGSDLRGEDGRRLAGTVAPLFGPENRDASQPPIG
jgi:hypothetical protein